MATLFVQYIWKLNCPITREEPISYIHLFLQPEKNVNKSIRKDCNIIYGARYILISCMVVLTTISYIMRQKFESLSKNLCSSYVLWPDLIYFVNTLWSLRGRFEFGLLEAIFDTTGRFMKPFRNNNFRSMITLCSSFFGNFLITYLIFSERKRSF